MKLKYVAEDGTEFESAEKCKAYELALIPLSARLDALEIRELRNIPPILYISTDNESTGALTLTCNSFRWFSITNATERNLVNNHFNVEISEGGVYAIGHRTDDSGYDVFSGENSVSNCRYLVRAIENYSSQMLVVHHDITFDVSGVYANRISETYGVKLTGSHVVRMSPDVFPQIVLDFLSDNIVIRIYEGETLTKTYRPEAHKLFMRLSIDDLRTLLTPLPESLIASPGRFEYVEVLSEMMSTNEGVKQLLHRLRETNIDMGVPASLMNSLYALISDTDKD